MSVSMHRLYRKVPVRCIRVGLAAEKLITTAFRGLKIMVVRQGEGLRWVNNDGKAVGLIVSRASCS